MCVIHHRFKPTFFQVGFGKGNAMFKWLMWIDLNTLPGIEVA